MRQNPEVDDLQDRIAVLSSLGGAAAALDLLSRFRDQIARLLDGASDQALLAEAHRLAGLSGMLGLRDLEIACRMAESGADDRASIDALRRTMERYKSSLSRHLALMASEQT
jgi:HPt (histidine-containing phosphotransfer) domain-containing protein